MSLLGGHIEAVANQSINQSINPSIRPSINQSVPHRCNSSPPVWIWYITHHYIFPVFVSPCCYPHRFGKHPHIRPFNFDRRATWPLPPLQPWQLLCRFFGPSQRWEYRDLDFLIDFMGFLPGDGWTFRESCESKQRNVQNSKKCTKLVSLMVNIWGIWWWIFGEFDGEYLVSLMVNIWEYLMVWWWTKKHWFPPRKRY